MPVSPHIAALQYAMSPVRGVCQEWCFSRNKGRKKRIAGFVHGRGRGQCEMDQCAYDSPYDSPPWDGLLFAGWAYTADVLNIL